MNYFATKKLISFIFVHHNIGELNSHPNDIIKVSEIGLFGGKEKKYENIEDQKNFQRKLLIELMTI